jgi:adenosylmethionine-8-amino-7-oxononanoate aminotransferase
MMDTTTAGDRHPELQQAAREHLLLHYTRHASFRSGHDDLVVLTRGEGAHVWDSRGRCYIDALSALYCSQLGYSYGGEMADAAREQLERLPFATNWATAHPPAIELAQRLADLAPGPLTRAFFTSGGSESVEAAWKLARQYHLARGEPGRTKAVARRNAYHGMSLGALAFTAVPAMKEPFGAPAVETIRVPNTNRFRAPDATDERFCERILAATEAGIVAAGPEPVAMLIAEPIQNAGGCLVPPDGYCPGLRELADRYGFLLVADEVISAFGRVGEWFGSTRYGAAADMVTIAKGLTSAYAPMGAVLVSDRVVDHLDRPDTTLLHGVTFGGHPVAAAIALRNLEIFERDDVLENVRRLERHFGSRM